MKRLALWKLYDFTVRLCVCFFSFEFPRFFRGGGEDAKERGMGEFLHVSKDVSKKLIVFPEIEQHGEFLTVVEHF